MTTGQAGGEPDWLRVTVGTTILAMVAAPATGLVGAAWIAFASNLMDGRGVQHAVAGIPLGLVWLGPIGIVLALVTSANAGAITVAFAVPLARIGNLHMRAAAFAAIFASAAALPAAFATVLASSSAPIGLSLPALILALTFGMGWGTGAIIYRRSTPRT